MKYAPKLSHTPPLIKQKLEESFGESPESLESELASSSHELGDSSSSPAVSGTKVAACVGENSINQLSLTATYLKTFLL